MYVDVETILTAAKLVGAIVTIAGIFLAAHKWYLKQNSLGEKVDALEAAHETDIKELKDKHNDDIRKIEEEACLHTYGILACLKGLQEQGCNGPVTETIDRFEKYINKRAHDQEE